MNQKLFGFVLLLSLVSVTFASGVSLNQAIIGNVTAIQINSASASALTQTKLGNGNEEYLASNGSVIATTTILNSIDFSKTVDGYPLMLDCDIVTCDLKQNITFSNPTMFTNTTLIGAEAVGQASSITYWIHNITYNITSPTYAPATINQTFSNGTILYNPLVQNGSSTSFYNQSIIDSNIVGSLFQPGTYEFDTRFTKNSPTDEIEIHTVLGGIPDTSVGWWNSSWTAKVNCTITNWTTASTTYDHIAVCNINTSNTTFFSPTPGAIRVLLNDSGAPLDYIWNDNSTTFYLNSSNDASLLVAVPNQTSSYNLTIYGQNVSAVSNMENTTQFCSDLNMTSFYTGNSTNDICSRNSLTAQNGATEVLVSGASPYGYAFAFPATGEFNTTSNVGFPSGSTGGAITLWAKQNGSTYSSNTAVIFMGTAATNQGRTIYLGSGGSVNLDSFGANGLAIGTSKATLGNLNYFAGYWGTSVNLTFNTSNTQAGGTVATTRAAFRIGAANTLSDFGASNQGSTISQVRVYAYPISYNDELNEYLQNSTIGSYSILSVAHPSLSPNPAYSSSTIQGSSNDWLNLVNISAINWTLYVNGSNFTSGAITNGSLGFPPQNISLFNISGFSYKSNLTLFVSENYTDASFSSMNSTNLTISAPVLTITQNSTVNTTLFPTMQLQYNVSATDNVNSSFFLHYNVTKNGAVVVGPVTVLVSNNTPYYINVSGNLTVGDMWALFVQADDSVVNTSINNTPNTTVLDPFTSIGYLPVETISNPDNMNATTINATGATDVICNLQYPLGTAYNSPTKTVLVQNITYNQLVQIPVVSVPTTETGNWICNFTSQFENITENRSFSNNVTPNVIALCNASITTNSINYSTYDQDTLAPLNATLSAVYSYLNLSTSITNQSNQTFVCVSPSNFNVSAIASETANYSGYQTNSIVRPAQYYNNQSIIRKIYLLNTSASTTVTVSVQNTNFQPLANYTVLLYKYYPAFNSYNLTNSGVTNNVGQVVFFIETAPTQYQGIVLDPFGKVQQNVSGIIFCTATAVGSPCTYTFYIGTQLSPNYYTQPSVINNGSQTTYNTTSGFNNLVVTDGPFCSLNNATMVLFCSFPGAANTTNFLGTNLTLYNSTEWYNNNTALLTFASSGTNQSLVVPNKTGVYTYVFYSNNYNTTTSYQITYVQVIESGGITVNPPVANQYGTDGWILALIMVMAIAFATYRLPVIFVISTCAVLELTSIIGLITLSGYTQAFILLVGLGVAYFVRD